VKQLSPNEDFINWLEEIRGTAYGNAIEKGIDYEILKQNLHHNNSILTIIKNKNRVYNTSALKNYCIEKRDGIE